MIHITLSLLLFRAKFASVVNRHVSIGVHNTSKHSLDANSKFAAIWCAAGGWGGGVGSCNNWKRRCHSYKSSSSKQCFWTSDLEPRILYIESSHLATRLSDVAKVNAFQYLIAYKTAVRPEITIENSILNMKGNKSLLDPIPYPQRSTRVAFNCQIPLGLEL